MVVRRDRLPGHFAPAFGASAGLLEFPPITTAMAFLFITLRGLVSAAVRLGIVGPLQAQAMQYDAAPYAQAVAERFMDAPVISAAQTAPLIDILQGSQDRLYSRLFQT
jgi:urease accessory protein